nr:hypothetical protein L204_01574 [Cryptococcus depauperatus CBS 7855]
MRGRKSGTFINVSSVAARDPLAACSVYAASKAALEVAPHNIRLLIVELGNFRTNFVSARIFVAATGEGLAGKLNGQAIRVVLGSDALRRIKAWNENWATELSLQEDTAPSTDFAG